MPKKLYVYDQTSWQDRWQAAGRFKTNDPDVITIAASSINDVINGMDKLVTDRVTFDRMLFQTHGSPGVIFFGKDDLTGPVWFSHFAGRFYERLLPGAAKIYFDGCRVAWGPAGVIFLQSAGRVLLGPMGGEVIAWTSSGSGIPGAIPLLGGHTAHMTGEAVRVVFGHGDRIGQTA